MKNVNFLGKKCVYFKHISHIVIDELDIFHHTAMDLEYGEKSENGEYNLLTEDQLAQIYLGKGKGVLYKGYIVFEADLIENNEHYDAFYSLYGWIKKNYEAYLNGVVFHSLKDKFQFNQVKSIIMLYQSGFFLSDKLQTKLGNYLNKEAVEMVINEVHQTMKKAG